MKLYYAAISPDGKILGLEEDAESALALVQRKVGGPVAVQVADEPEANPENAPTAEEMAELAYSSAQLSPISAASVMNMKLATAHELLLPYFAGMEKRGEVVTKYKTASGMADAWIGQNYKTLKPSQDVDRPVEVMGVTLVPAAHAKLAALRRGPYERIFDVTEEAIKRRAHDKKIPYTPKMFEEATAAMVVEGARMAERWKDPSIGLPQRIGSKFTWCQGSSKECRDSCLIFAGQNASERYNTYRKVAQAHALLGQPTAFMRVLMESIDKWMGDCTFYRRPDPNQEVTPMFRLNVLSDIPWERIVPWFFTHYRGRSGENGRPLVWYDYTKVPGRRAPWMHDGKRHEFPDNYDLTFSLSGTDVNEQYAIEEIDRYNSRLAVVFMAYKKADGTWQTLLKKGEEASKQIPLPSKPFKIGRHELKIVDGDLSDARPNDPDKVCVGLRWKIPSGKRSGAETDYELMDIGGEQVEMMMRRGAGGELKRLSFVTPIYIKGSKDSAYEPNPDDDGVVLISAVTPRQQPIIHHLTQPF